jgi:competence protein ComEC
MRVHFIDVGQGAATLFEFDDGAVLVDTGGEETAAFHSNEHLERYLSAFFARRKDLHGRLASLILTHPHVDHTRGVPVVLERFAPSHVVTNGQTKGSGSEQQIALQDWAGSRPGIAHEAVHLESIPPRGLTDEIVDPVHGSDVDPVLTVLWGQVASDPGWGLEREKPAFDNENNHCVVLRVDFGKASFLVTGDLEIPAITDMVKRYEGTGMLDVDVYEVGHHGALNGTTSEFLSAMTPKYAVIEVGKPDHEADYCAWKFGHPRKEILDMLQSAVQGTREPIRVRAGLDWTKFEDYTVQRAIYATGWDGTIVIEAAADGTLRFVPADSSPP